MGLLVLISFLFVNPAAAGSNAEEQEGWRFFLAPYLWFTSVSGELTVVGQDLPVDTPFSDILKTLDFGAMAHLEAGKGRWSAFLDPLYSKSSSEFADSSGASSTGTIRMWVVELGGGFQILPTGRGWLPRTTAILGARYWSQNAGVEPEGNPEQTIKKNWIDPFVGLRLQFELSERVAVNLRGDVGGFDISDNTSDFSWHAWANGVYNVSSSFSVWVGYRGLYAKYDEGQTDQRYVYDATLHGPTIGAGIRF